MRVGGCANDIPPGWVDKLQECLPRVVELTNEIDVLLTRNRIFVDRTRDIGAIGAEEAIDWGFTGPCLRACGVNYDVRKAHPYSVYPRLDFEVPLGSAATRTIGTSCGWRRSGSRTGSSNSAWSRCRRDRSSWTTGATRCRRRRTCSAPSKA